MHDFLVGVEYSYGEDASVLATTDSQVVANATDHHKTLTLEIHTFLSNPLFLVSESYGGNLAMTNALVERAIYVCTLVEARLCCAC
jgi:serine carboxypeptidase 1